MPPNAPSTAPATTGSNVPPGTADGRLSQVEEIADFVVFLLSERSGVVTGSIIDWDQNVLGCRD